MAISTYVTAPSAARPPQIATEALRRMLTERRRELINEIRNKMRDVRTETPSRPTSAADDTTEVEPEDDLAFVLIQMKSHMLNRINLALQRLDEGTYGCCIDCADAITVSRLQALPFAVRCRDCEERREGKLARAAATKVS
jgi:DnaK suppressor protein